ncbi:hypothetical protein GLYMA_06G311550v4 [Glycine max]|nr:hypothetical protein GLYMA_06G311550v4 [Glycine max]KAH1128389.1 hypothetical protein GYH30_016792 [Glycine max]
MKIFGIHIPPFVQRTLDLCLQKVSSCNKILIETMKSKYFKKLDNLYKGLNRRYEQLGYVSQPPKIREMAKCEHHKRALENTFALFQVNKSEITPDFEQRVDNIEKYIYSITKPKYVSSQLQISQVEATSTNIPTSQVMGPHDSHMTQPNSHQVANQSSAADPQEESVKQQGYGNVVQQQTSGEITPPVISTSGILASPLLENCNEENENCQGHIVISDDASPAMQHSINVMNFVSAEALVDSCEDIGMVFHLNDGKSTLEPLNGPPLSAIGSDLEGVNVTDSQARYLTRRKFAPRERNMNHFINSMPASEIFLQLTSSEKLFSNSSTSQENNALSEEIKEINMRLIDTEVVADKGKIVTTAAEGYIAHGEGLTVKLLFNSVSVNVNPMSNHGSYKKPIIQPLWLHIPASYPHCSVAIIDEMPLEARKDLDEDLSMKAKLKLTLCLQRLSQPLSLKDIAVSWDRCVREAICEYAQLFGGGTFTSKYGGWEICPNDI